MDGVVKKKVLFCATVDYHFKAFHLPYLKWFKEQGWEVHVAAQGDLTLPFVDKRFNIPIQRSPLHKMNIKAYKDLKKIINENHYSIIHCHTPMGGVLSRLVARDARKKGTKVIYTAHGFHFCKGAPLINWLLYYPIEKFLASLTDCLITINQEDYLLAKNHRFKAKSIKHVHGVGVNTEIFKPLNESQKHSVRESLGYKPNDFLMFYAAEFNKNKNQRLLIEALVQIKYEVPNAKLLLAGEGLLLEDCKDLARKLNVDDMVQFLGFRNDIENLLKISDIAVASSLREGLPVNIMEAMACGLPTIANNNRGHRELVQNDQNGWLINNQSAEFAHRIKKLAYDSDLKKQLGIKGRKKILSNFSIQNVLDEKSEIYRGYMNEMEDILWVVH
ncbi:glycosyltransferase family 4 protein [Neobacillus sp. MER 74]|uniref:glycosyltransferase family 4 protein n=1 Tax=Neobacillus sp. MER 74 TaxID=2939566 RepID=UPI002040B97A|nr:glycosyltransferase family 4 protein [Neobacillus sp. MER 74]MCM3115099.1 glycosyltransferase family 4 protein [Neobacillus sp. MER 74]